MSNSLGVFLQQEMTRVAVVSTEAHEMCKAWSVAITVVPALKSFYRPDALPVAKPMASKHLSVLMMILTTVQILYFSYMYHVPEKNVYTKLWLGTLTDYCMSL